MDALSGLLPEGIAYLDTSGSVVVANRPGPGPDPDPESPSGAGWSLGRCVVPDERESFEKYLADAATDPQAPARQFSLVDAGNVLSAKVRVGPLSVDGRLTGFLAVASPREEDVATRAALQESEATLRSVMAAAPIGIGLVQDRILGWTNDYFLRMVGYSREELIGQSARILYESDEEFERVARVKHPEIVEKGVGSVVTRFRHRDGRAFDILLNSAAIHPPDLSAGIVFTALDVTSQMAAERRLRESEESYRSLVSNALYGIYRSSAEGRFLDVNPALVQMLGYDHRDEVLSCDLAKDVYAHAKDRERLTAEFWQREAMAGQEVEWRRKDGSTILVRLSGRPIRNDRGDLTSWEMVVENVSERRALEAQLQRSQRLEAIGQLAGGIAHDFNNLLTAIGGYSEILLRDLSAKDPSRRKVREIHKAGRRAAKLTRQLLAFSRRQVLTPGILGVNDVVSGMESMLRRIIGENLELVTDLDPGLGQVKADEAQIEQVILNLAVNSRDAMPHGGRLVIGTKNYEVPESRAGRTIDAPPGSYVSLTVSDTGVGMEEATVDRIFEPFFTTKSRERGTGLGLSTVYGIVRQSDGHIYVKSSPDEGAKFLILFPRVEDPVSARRRPPMDPGSLAGSETILLVEDESSVRTMAGEVLESRGYRVLSAESAEQALEICRAHPGHIDLLLTDVVLPGMSGPELADDLSRTMPDLRLVFMSGYLDAKGPGQTVLERGVPFVEKPFSPWDLAAHVRRALDGGE